MQVLRHKAFLRPRFIRARTIAQLIGLFDRPPAVPAGAAGVGGMRDIIIARRALLALAAGIAAGIWPHRRI